MIQQPVLYQIGDVVLHAHHRSQQSRQFQARGTSVELVDTYKVLTSTSAHKTSIRRETADILLYSNGVFSPSQQGRLLERQVGVFTDVFSYVYTTREPALANDCGCALCGCCPCNIMFLHNVGRLVSVNIQPASPDFYAATLEFELHSYWKPINTLLWSQGGLGLSRPFNKLDFDDIAIDSKVMQLPTCDTLFTACIQFYKKQFISLDFMNDPYWLGEFICRTPQNYPAIGFIRDWSNGTSTSHVVEEQIYWSAPPLSMYMFRHLPILTSQADIYIVRQEANRSIESHVTINFERVNNLASDNGITLLASDVLKVGDVDGFAHVYRRQTEEIILYCAEAINYNDGDFPGYLTPGTNTVYINPRGAEYAQFHLYRSL